MAEESKGLEFNFWGLGLSRLIRYSYPGFLLLVMSALFRTTETREFVAALGAPLTALAAIVVGAGVYVLHRSLVIPLHHAALTGLLGMWEAWRWKPSGPTWTDRFAIWKWKGCGIRREDSLSPTRFLASVGVKWPYRMLAYTTLRRSRFFSNAEKLDIAHAELGVLFLTTGMLVLCAFITPAAGSVLKARHETTFWVLAVALYIAAQIAAGIQHRAECMFMNPLRRRVYLIRLLDKAGIPRWP